MKEKRYEIGGKTYVQRTLVLGQVKQIREVIAGLVVPSPLNVPDIMAALDDRLPLALAVVLTPEGESPRKKDLQSLADELEFSIEAETAVEVIEDFFICNPVASLSTKLAGMIIKVRSMMRTRTGSDSSACISPTETLPGETQSSGDIPLENAPPT